MPITISSGNLVINGIVDIGSIAKVQSNVYASTASSNTHPITLTDIPYAGSVLILCISADATIVAPIGWSLVEASVANTGTYIYWKIAGVSEPTTVVITLSSAVSTSCALAILEYTGISTLDKSANNAANGAGATSINTNTTAATTTANELVIVLGGWDSSPTFPTVSSWNNNFVTILNSASSGSVTNIGINVAIKIVYVIGTFSGTATLSSATDNPSGIIATFK